MNLKTYRAYTMAEALAAVKEDLGADASILHTRSYKRGGLFGLGRQAVVEVTACGAADSRRTRMDEILDAKRPAPAQVAASQAYQRTLRASAQPTQPPSRPQRPQSFESRRLDLLSAIEEHRRAVASAPTAPFGAGAANKSPGAPPGPDSAPARSAEPPRVVNRPAPTVEPRPQPTSPIASIAQRFILQSASSASGEGRRGAAPSAADVPPHAISVSASAGDPAGSDDELNAIHSMVSRVLQGDAGQRGREGLHSMPQPLFDLYLRMVGQELSDELAEQIVAAVKTDLSPVELEDADRVRRAVFERLAELVAVSEDAESPVTEDGRPLTIALIGPTGVGKTTTLAKLAATFKLRQGKRVGLITCDTYRIAAVEQLRTYANIIGLPLKVVLTPQEMADACRQLRDCDIVLIDTAGRSQRDGGRLRELARFIDAADPHQVHLVLSGTAGEKVLLHEAEAFSRVRVDRIILTKLDEAVSFGMLVNVVRRVGKKLSFLTNGQEVPADIEPGRRDRLVSLMLGEGAPA